MLATLAGPSRGFCQGSVQSAPGHAWATHITHPLKTICWSSSEPGKCFPCPSCACCCLENMDSWLAHSLHLCDAQMCRQDPGTQMLSKASSTESQFQPTETRFKSECVSLAFWDNSFLSSGPCFLSLVPSIEIQMNRKYGTQM